jgi:uncharacterized membrane protein
MRALLLAVSLVCLALLGTPSASADSIDGTIEVRLDPATTSIKLGDKIELRITVTNTGTAASPPLVVHLDVTNPRLSVSVDPEDWTSTLSKPIGSVDPGGRARVDWRIQPTSSGDFSAYAVALSPGADNLATSNVLRIDVAHRRILDPGGILGVVLAMPALVGALLLVQLRLSRRTRG